MTLMRRALIPFLAIATLVAGGVAWTATSASSATAPTHSLTLAGTDMHPIDAHMHAMFVDGGGVMGIFENSDGPPHFFHLEAGFQLPVGAKVTSVQVTAKSCGTNTPQAVFGSYQPTTGNTVQSATFNLAKSCTRQTLTKNANPITTVVAGRRYVIDFNPNEAASYPGDATDTNVFYGATVKYTCTSPCVP